MKVWVKAKSLANAEAFHDGEASGVSISAASGFPVGDPNILWAVVLMEMMPLTEDTNPVRCSGSRSPFGSVRGCETHKPSA